MVRIIIITALTLVTAVLFILFRGDTFVRPESSDMAEEVFAEKTETSRPVSTEPEPTTEAETTVSEPEVTDIAMPEGYELPAACALEMETVMQNPELPTGCEITALTQTLNYYGFSADKVTMADVFLKTDTIGYYTMNEVYIGNPHTDGFGCNAPVIVNAADDFFDYIGSDWYAVDLTGTPLEGVFYQIEQGRPTVIWTTMYQYETHAEYEFTLGCGEDFYFNPCQHCVTIFGYDMEEKKVHVADPLVGNVKYDMERFERIYDSMGRQAVVLCGKAETAGKEFRDDGEKAEWLAVNRPPEPADESQEG